MGAGKTGNGGKCKKSMRLSDSWGKLTAIDVETKERYMEAYREENKKIKRCIIHSKKESK